MERNSNVNNNNNPKQTKHSKELLYLEPTSDSSNDGINKKFLIGANGPSSANQLRTFKIERSSVLDRVKQFIPVIAASNEELAHRPDKVIEDVVEEGKPYIQMNLALGVLEEKKDENDENEASGSSSNNNESDIISPRNKKHSGNQRNGDGIIIPSAGTTTVSNKQREEATAEMMNFMNIVSTVLDYSGTPKPPPPVLATKNDNDEDDANNDNSDTDSSSSSSGDSNAEIIWLDSSDDEIEEQHNDVENMHG